LTLVSVVDEAPEQLVADVAVLYGREAVLWGRYERRVTPSQPVRPRRRRRRWRWWWWLLLVCAARAAVWLHTDKHCSDADPLELHLTTSDLWFGQEQEGILPELLSSSGIV